MSNLEQTLRESSRNQELNRRDFIRNALLAIGGVAASRFLPSNLYGQTEKPKDGVSANSKLYVKKVDRDVEEILQVLERVPDSIQKVINAYGQTVKITDGTFNSIEGYENDKSIEHSRFWRWFIGEDMGIYNNYDILVKKGHKSKIIRMFAVGDGRMTALHEYGHAVDRIFGISLNDSNVSSGFLSFSEKFRDAYRNSNKGFSFFPFTKLSIDQFFAERFADYYFSDKSRARRKNKSPLVYNYFKNFEDAVNSGQYSYLLTNRDKIFQFLYRPKSLQ